MEKIPLINTEEYLNKKLNQQEINDEESKEIIESILKLEKSILTIDEHKEYEQNYNDDKDVSIDNNRFNLSFKYSTLEDIELKEQIAHDYLISKLLSGLDSTLEQVKKEKNIDALKILENFSFVLKDDSGYVLKLSEILPDGYKVIIAPRLAGGFNDCSGALNTDKKYIYMRGDLTTLMFQIILLHEIGHIQDKINLDKLGVEELMTDSKFIRIAEKLRKERVASAYAIKKLKPLVKSGLISKEDIFNYLIKQALDSHIMDMEDEMDYIKGLK